MIKSFFLAIIMIAIMLPYSSSNANTNTNSVYDRVMKSKTLRCGYIIYEPAIYKNPKTGEFEGIVYELLEIIAKDMGIEVEWKEEVGFANFIEGLETDRYDVVCGTVWATTQRLMKADFLEPMWYSGVGVWVRVGDNRFNEDLSLINDPSVKISAIDGTSPSFISQKDFPKASVFSMPTLTDYSYNMLNVKNGKGDVTFVDIYQGNHFLENNPNTLKNIAIKSPIRVYPNSMVVKKGEFELFNMLNGIIRENIYNGVVGKLIDKYEKYPNSYYRVAKPYVINE